MKIFQFSFPNFFSYNFQIHFQIFISNKFSFHEKSHEMYRTCICKITFSMSHVCYILIKRIDRLRLEYKNKLTSGKTEVRSGTWTTDARAVQSKHPELIRQVRPQQLEVDDDLRFGDVPRVDRHPNRFAGYNEIDPNDINTMNYDDICCASRCINFRKQKHDENLLWFCRNWTT